MNRTLIVVVVAGLLAGSLIVAYRQARARAEMQAHWERLKAERAAELERASQEARHPVRPMIVRPPGSESSQSKPKGNTISNGTNRSVAESTNGAALTAQADTGAGTTVTPTPSKKAPLQDPVAREALAFVGADPEAEAVWVDAINNPDLPPKERQDLIEDLNEEGFADPKNLTPEDLPLILSRLALIEQYAPSAMDEVNLAAFVEAYKDLMNMAARLME